MRNRSWPESDEAEKTIRKEATREKEEVEKK